MCVKMRVDCALFFLLRLLFSLFIFPRSIVCSMYLVCLFQVRVILGSVPEGGPTASGVFMKPRLRGQEGKAKERDSKVKKKIVNWFGKPSLKMKQKVMPGKFC